MCLLCDRVHIILIVVQNPRSSLFDLDAWILLSMLVPRIAISFISVIYQLRLVQQLCNTLNSELAQVHMCVLFSAVLRQIDTFSKFDRLFVVYSPFVFHCSGCRAHLRFVVETVVRKTLSQDRVQFRKRFFSSYFKTNTKRFA